jgi:uncharacterized membrane protein YeaQ/YmgE (transglycosylase-associated protein family)
VFSSNKQESSTTGTRHAAPADAPHVEDVRTTEGFTMVGLIISLIVIGLIAGAIARLLVPGKQDIGVVMTIVLGMIGSFVGGFLGYLIFHKDASNGFLQPSGIIGSVIGAVIVLLIYTRAGRRHTVRH